MGKRLGTGVHLRTSSKALRVPTGGLSMSKKYVCYCYCGVKFISGLNLKSDRKIMSVDPCPKCEERGLQAAASLSKAEDEAYTNAVVEAKSQSRS